MEKLRDGASVADVGCGLGASTIILAKAFEHSSFVGYDIHEPSIEAARKAAAARRASTGGPGSRWRPRRTSRAPATTWSPCSTACTTWATRSERPAGSASRCAEDGTLLLVEPAAGERLEDNLNPVSRLYYGLSTVICTPSSLAQEVGLGLGAQAGPQRLEEVLHEAGFSHVRVATQTPFNLIIEARA